MLRHILTSNKVKLTFIVPDSRPTKRWKFSKAKLDTHPEK